MACESDIQMTYKMYVGGKSVNIVITARNKAVAKEIFLKSDYGKYAPPHQVKAVPLSNKNPQPCEYCKLIHASYMKAVTPKEKRRAMARLRLHVKQVHKNPPPRRKIKYLKLAGKLARGVYNHVKTHGTVIPLPKRTPAIVKKYVGIILDANGIKYS